MVERYSNAPSGSGRGSAPDPLVARELLAARAMTTRTSRRAATVCLILALGLATASAFQIAPEDHHRQITFQAIKKLGLADSPAFDFDYYMLQIGNADSGQDLHQGENRFHVDNCAFAASTAYVREQWQLIASLHDPHDLGSVHALGRLLHAVQDFYAHSNWIELHVNSPTIPLWNLDPATLPQGCYSGRWNQGTNLCGPGVPHHDEMNKDAPTTPRGRVVVATGPHKGQLLFDLAAEAAMRATMRELTRYFRLTDAAPPTASE